MSDIFISYASEDRERVRALADALTQEGFSVWRDRKIRAGQAFDSIIEQALDAAQCVIVCWSEPSVKSEWVKNEAAVGAERGILVPVFLDDVRLPLEFRRRQTLSLVQWKESPSFPGFVELCATIRSVIDGTAAPVPVAVPPGTPPRRAWRRTWVAAAVVFVTVVAGGLSYLTLEWVALPKVKVVAPYPVVAQILSGGRGVSRGVFTPRGYVIAMAHGVPDPANLVVGWEEGGERRQSAAEVVRRGSGEVLLLRLSGRPLQQYSLSVRIAATLQPEEHVERYLSPTDRAPGQVKQLFATRDIGTGDGHVRLSRLLVTTMIAGPGDSGAPVVDGSGRVVGLIYGASQTETLSLMIEDIKAYFSEAF